MAPRGKVYMQNSMGPSTEPRGTPKASSLNSLNTPSIDTHYVLPLRYDLNSSKARKEVEKNCVINRVKAHGQVQQD